MSNLVSAVGLWPLLGSALPLLVALATKRETKSGYQGLLFVALAAVAGFAEAFVKAHNSGAAFNLHAAVASAAGVLVVGQSMHLAVWKSTGIAAKLQSLGSSANAEVQKFLSPAQYSDLKQHLGHWAEDLGQKLQTNAASVDASAKAVAQAASVVASAAVSATVAVAVAPPVSDPIVAPPLDAGDSLVAPPL